MFSDSGALLGLTERVKVRDGDGFESNLFFRYDDGEPVGLHANSEVVADEAWITLAE